jgi:tetratricopeptide (TPR) repeat protein
MNDYRPNTAAMERSQSLMTQLQGHHERERWPERRDRLRKELDAGGDYRIKNDLATTLAHTGEPAESVKLLQQIEQEKPGLYETASNLGTAFELVGENQKALDWIRRGIELQAEAHAGTEWLHVRILEAKLALTADPHWLESNSVLGPRQAETVLLSATGNRTEPLTSDQVKNALLYQLHERLQFVPAPDAIVGDLLLVLGQLVAQEPSGVGGALEVYRLADRFLVGSDLEPLVTHRLAEARSMQRVRKGLLVKNAFLIGLLAAGVILPLLVISIMRRLQRRSAND